MRWLLFLLLTPTAFAQADPFALLDADRDGKLSRSEVPEPLRPQFPLVDTDRDGFISRGEFQQAIAGIGGGSTSPATEMEWLKDQDYAGQGNSRQKLDLLLPKDRSSGKRPMVVFVHGGGWKSGRKEDGHEILKVVTASGDYAAATINYRLSQEAKWPAQIHDCKAAIRFLRAKAGEYGIDPDRIGVMGMSAGGHLVSLLGTVDDAALEGAIGRFAGVSSRVRCVVNFFGPTDFVTYFASKRTAALESGEKMVAELLGRTEEEVRRNAAPASPVTWATRDDAPFFTAHGTLDDLVPFSQATAIHRSLGKAGVETHLVAVEGAGHGFASRELNLRIRQFLDKHLRDVPAEISSEPIRLR